MPGVPRATIFEVPGTRDGVIRCRVLGASERCSIRSQVMRPFRCQVTPVTQEPDDGGAAKAGNAVRAATKNVAQSTRPINPNFLSFRLVAKVCVRYPRERNDERRVAVGSGAR